MHLAVFFDGVDGVDPARRAKVFIWRNVGPARRVTLPSKKGDPARRVTLPAEPTFVTHVNGSPSFVRRCGKVGLPKVALVGE